MGKKIKVCVISVYFGKLPEWFDIWLSTASYNKSIDFLVVTDQSVEKKIRNIKIMNMSFNEFKQLAQKKLNYNIKLNSPYKLCDYKEVWGKILEDELGDYDYWGECDNDIVFGDLRSFFSKYDLKKYDKFGCRGHFTLYRNNEEVISRYKLNGGWFGTYKEIFSSNMSWAFDETPGINAIYEKYGFSSMNEIIFADIDVNYFDLRLVDFGSNSPRNYDNQLFYWSKGKLLRSYRENNELKKDEFMYIHLQKRKMSKPKFNPFNNKDFLIINENFIQKEIDIDNDIRKYNLKKDDLRNNKRFGGKYKKDLRFYWLGRRILNIQYYIKNILKKTKIYKVIKKRRY